MRACPGYVPWELNLQICGSAGAAGVQPQEILQEQRSDTNPWFESDALKVGAYFVSAQAFGRSPGPSLRFKIPFGAYLTTYSFYFIFCWPYLLAVATLFPQSLINGKGNSFLSSWVI